MLIHLKNSNCADCDIHDVVVRKKEQQVEDKDTSCKDEEPCSRLGLRRANNALVTKTVELFCAFGTELANVSVGTAQRAFWTTNAFLRQKAA